MMTQQEDYSNPSGISRQGMYPSFKPSEQPLLDPEKLLNSPNTKTEMWKVFYMGVCFLLLNTAAISQNLLSQIYQQLGYDSLGTFILLTQSFFYVVGVLTVPGIIKNWEYKRGINVGAFGYIIVLIAGAMTTACGENKNLAWCQQASYIYGSNIIFALLHGFTAPMFWLCGNRYIAGCASDDKKGQAMGTFVGLFSGALILGSIISKLTITRFGNFGYYLISAGFACLVMLMFMVAPNVQREKEEDAEEKVIEKTKKILKLMTGEKMRKLLPYMLYAGLINATIAAFQYRLVQNTDDKMTPEELNKITTTINLMQGVIITVSSVVAGKLTDILKRKSVLHLFNFVQAIGMVLAFASFYEKSLFLVYGMAVFWGIGCFGANTVIVVTMVKDFEGSIESYAVPQIMTPLATAIGYGLCLFPEILIVLSVLVGFLVLNVISTSFYKTKE